MVNNKYISLEKKKDIYSNKLKKAEKKKIEKKKRNETTSLSQFQTKKKNMSELLEFKDLDINNITFDELYTGSYFKNIPIGVVSNDDDDKVQPFLFNTPNNLYSSGIKEILDREKKFVVGYNICINLINNKNPKPEEKEFCEKLDGIQTYIKEYIESIKNDHEIDQHLVDNFKIINWSINPDTGEKYNPRLFVKLLMNNKIKKILSNFYEEKTNQETDAVDLLGKPLLLTGAIKFENISINNKRIQLEAKLVESLFTKLEPRKPNQTQTKRSILRPNVDMIRKRKEEVVQPLEKKIEDGNTFANLEIL